MQFRKDSKFTIDVKRIVAGKNRIGVYEVFIRVTEVGRVHDTNLTHTEQSLPHFLDGIRTLFQCFDWTGLQGFNLIPDGKVLDCYGCRLTIDSADIPPLYELFDEEGNVIHKR